MKNCSDCGTDNLDFNESCSKCGASLKRINYDSSKLSNSNSNDNYQYSKPGFTTFFNIIGTISIICGLICAIVFWPNSFYGYIAFVPSVSWLLSGGISAFIFFALGRIIDDLAFIKENISSKH